MPPRPRRVEFPPTRLLFDIAPRKKPCSRTPWWRPRRLLAAALRHFAAAGPIWNPPTGVAGSQRAAAILLDDGWSAAVKLGQPDQAADELIANADSDRRASSGPLSEPARDITLMPAGNARVALRQLTPRNPIRSSGPRPSPPSGASSRRPAIATLLLLSDGVDDRNLGRGPDLLEGLGKTIGDHALTIFQDLNIICACAGPAAEMLRRDGYGGKVLRTMAPCRRRGARLRPRRGCLSGKSAVRAGGSRGRGRATFHLPVELRNDIARLAHRRRTVRRRRAIARQALAAACHPAGERIENYTAAAAAGLDLLDPTWRCRCSPTCGLVIRGAPEQACQHQRSFSTRSCR